MWWTGGLGAGAAGAYLFGLFVAFGGEPYTGTWPEILGSALLSVSALLGCRAVAALLGPAGTRRYLGAVMDTGAMALTPYSLQIVALGLVMTTVRPGQLRAEGCVRRYRRPNITLSRAIDYCPGVGRTVGGLGNHGDGWRLRIDLRSRWGSIRVSAIVRSVGWSVVIGRWCGGSVTPNCPT
jgi:hypothetical protein